MNQREDGSDTQEAFVVYYNPTRLKAFAVYVAFVAYGIPPILVIDAYHHKRIGTALWVLCALFVMAFSPLLVKIVRLLISPQPAVTISHEGILDNAALAAASGWIPWNNIQKVYLDGKGLIRAVHIIPYDRRKMFAGKPFFTRLNMLTRTLQPGAAPIQIMCLLLAISPDELLAAMERYQPHRNAAHIG